MKIDDYTLGDLGFKIIDGFPKREREKLISAVKSITKFKKFGDVNHGALDQELDNKLKHFGYVWDKDNTLRLDGKHPCFLWSETKHSVDFYNSESKIAIEIEKTEVKRIPHDVLKFLLASEIGKVEYGVLIIPKMYPTSTQDRKFERTVIGDIQFYFKGVIPKYPDLKDILFIVYDLD